MCFVLFPSCAFSNAFEITKNVNETVNRFCFTKLCCGWKTVNITYSLSCSTLSQVWVMVASGHTKLTHIMAFLPAIGRDSSLAVKWHCLDLSSSCPEKSSHTGLCFSNPKEAMHEWLIHHSHFINSSFPSPLLLYYVPPLRKKLSLAKAKTNKITLSSDFFRSWCSVAIWLLLNLSSPKCVWN